MRSSQDASTVKKVPRGLSSKDLYNQPENSNWETDYDDEDSESADSSFQLSFKESYTQVT